MSHLQLAFLGQPQAVLAGQTLAFRTRKALALLAGCAQPTAETDALRDLRAIRRGIEKESLRITGDGKLAQTPHPAALGSALTHSAITTDYSEALLEFITPVSTDIGDSLRFLEDIHSFVYQQLDDEILWSASMPCIVAGDAGIPVFTDTDPAPAPDEPNSDESERYWIVVPAQSSIDFNFEIELLGKPYAQAPFGYQSKCLGWLREDLAGLSDDARSRIEPVLRDAGCWTALSAD